MTLYLKPMDNQTAKHRKLQFGMKDQYSYIIIYCKAIIELCPVGWAVEYTNCFSAEELNPLNKCPGNDTKQSDGEVPVMLELWEMQSTPSLPSLPGPLWPGMVAPDRILSIGQIKLTYVLMLNWIAWNITVLTFKLHTYVKLNCLK